jgi:CheY-like chemotaxis protein
VEILTAANGLEALQVVAGSQPDLIFLDINMPGMDGFAVLKHLKPIRMPRISRL